MLRTRLGLLLAMTVLMATVAFGRTDTILQHLTTRAEAFVNSLLAGNAIAVRGEMAPSMRRTLSADAVRTIFGELHTRGGGLESVEPGIVRQMPNGHVVVDVPMHYKKSSVAAQVVFERGGPDAKIIGFSIQPWDQPRAKPADEPVDVVPPPPGVEARMIRERPIEVASGDRLLPGVVTSSILATPQRRVPGVLLLSGAGPFDADMTIGPNKPMRDLAQMIAEDGAVVLRVARREAIDPTVVAPGSTASVEDLFLADAEAAYRTLAAMPEVTTDTLSIVAHDVAGYVAPELAKRLKPARVVLLAPMRPPVATHLRRQLERMRAGAESEEERAAVDSLVSAAARLAAGGLAEDEQVFGYPGRLWNDLQKLRPDSSLMDDSIPYLILSGENDALMPEEDHRFWLDLAKGRTGRVFAKRYAGIGHSFIPFDDTSGESELSARGNVDPRVGEDISRFVREGLPPR